jgi:hypothetical protein
MQRSLALASIGKTSWGAWIARWDWRIGSVYRTGRLSEALILQFGGDWVFPRINNPLLRVRDPHEEGLYDVAKFVGKKNRWAYVSSVLASLVLMDRRAGGRCGRTLGVAARGRDGQYECPAETDHGWPESSPASAPAGGTGSGDTPCAAALGHPRGRGMIWLPLTT